MWWLLCQGTEFLFFTLNGYCKSSQSSETLSTCLNGSQGTECSVGTVHVFMKALPSQVRAAEFQLLSASLLPQDVSEHMCSSSALPASQPPVQDVPCPLEALIAEGQTPLQTHLLSSAKQLFKLLSERDSEWYETLWDSGCVWYHIVQVGLETCSWWCDMGMGMSVKPWRDGNRLQTTT